MKYKTLLLSMLLPILLPGNTAHADWKETLGNMWGSTEEKTKDYYNAITDKSVLPVSPEMVNKESSKHLKKVWTDVLENLDEALELNAEIDDAPESRWFGADKQSLAEDQVDIFRDIEELLGNPGITASRKHIDTLKDRIQTERHRIAGWKEKKVVASGDEKETLDHKIQKSLNKITDYNHNIDLEKNNLQIRLQQMGLLLSNEQVGVLLSRVDSDDIIKMSAIYGVLNDITSQLMELTQEFDEDINQARKYYGMHVILLKFVMNLQQTYINKLDKEYLPKINRIRTDTARLTEESKRLLQAERKPSRRDLLSRNLQSQALTLKVANIYAQQLGQQKSKVLQALELVKSDYRVAKNTYDTVKISADLIQLMKSNQASFTALMNIQIPDIVPFKNIEMQKKFEELSLLLKE